MNTQIPTVSFITFLRNAKRILTNPLPFHRENFAKHGNIFQVNLGFGNSVIFTRDEALVKHMLQTQHRKYHKSPLQTDQLGHYVGHGLLTSNGDYWLKQRRLIQPAFYKKKLESVKAIILSAVQTELEAIQTNKPQDVHPIMSDLAFNVVGKSLFSYTDDGKAMRRLQHITGKVQEDLIKEIRQPFKKWWFKLNGAIKKTESLAQETRDLLKGIINERKNTLESQDDLLDMLLNSKYDDGSSMTMEQLIDEILILFAAGHETTSNALVFTLMLLSKNPEIQDKIYQESQTLNASEMTMMEFFVQTPYTKKCIDEAMRMYPPIYFSDRMTIEDDQFNGLELKKGTSVLMSFYEIHRNPEFWKSPELYNPDRFDNIDKKELSNWFFPFGAGPRMCVGNNLAMYEMLVTVTEIVKKYYVKPAFKTIEIQPLITLRPVNGKLLFEKR